MGKVFLVQWWQPQWQLEAYPSLRLVISSNMRNHKYSSIDLLNSKCNGEKETERSSQTGIKHWWWWQQPRAFIIRTVIAGSWWAAGIWILKKTGKSAEVKYPIKGVFPSISIKCTCFTQVLAQPNFQAEMVNHQFHNLKILHTYLRTFQICPLSAEHLTVIQRIIRLSAVL